MNKKIVVLYTLPETNRGGEVLLEGLLKSIHFSLPDIKIEFFSTRLNRDRKFNKFEINIIKHPWYQVDGKPEILIIFRTIFLIFKDFLYRIIYKLPWFHRLLKVPWFEQYDLLLDPTIDAFNESFYGIKYSLYTLFNIFLSKAITHKRLVMIPATIGPFSNNLTMGLGKHILKHVDIIGTRGEISKEYLKKMGIPESKIIVFGDMGFLAGASSNIESYNILNKEGVNLSSDSILIGFTPNQHMFKLLSNRYGYNYTDYIALMTETIEYIIEKTNGTVLLIPHDLKHDDENEDDRYACRQLFNNLKHIDNIKCILTRYSAGEIKGIIRYCQMFIGLRMHSTIGSTSMYVPTVAIGYGFKFKEVFVDMLGQQDCFVNIENSNLNKLLEEIKEKIDFVFHNKDSIREDLKIKISQVRQNSLAFGQTLKQMLD